MRVRTIEIQNYQSIEQSGLIRLGPVTLLVGRNNSGKSTIIKALHAIQVSGHLLPADIRYGAPDGARIIIGLADADTARWGQGGHPVQNMTLDLTVTTGAGQQPGVLTFENGGSMGVHPLQAVEPVNFIYPYLAGRKVTIFEETINQLASLEVRNNLSNLTPKVDRLSDQNHPRNNEFRNLVKEVIGLPLSPIASPQGKQIGMWVDETDWIELSSMGAGVAQMLGLITQLCMATEGKLFLIEELENDIHPEGLKALLRVIEKRSKKNQFVISTHSNIVVRHLGAIETTKIYEVNNEVKEDGKRRLPTTSIRPVGNDVSERSRLLASLGYELSDFDLYDGWLILEESSAERIIRDHLVRWFAPSLSRVRTVASRGTSDLERSFEALEKLVLFTHLQDIYRGRIRVFADGEPTGHDAIARLRSRYRGWPEESFNTFDKSDFELYYPERFQEAVLAALTLKGQEKRREKQRLLERVLEWILANEETAKHEFEESAASVIVHLTQFETSLKEYDSA